MRIWFQLMASEHRSPGFMSAVQEQLERVVSTGTEVSVRGTTHGAFSDQFRLLFHYDEREIISAGLRAQEEGYDVFAIGNSLDPGVVALREVLDIPVVVQMEVSSAVACMTGERFGIVATNDKFGPRYREIVRSYGLESRLAGVDSVRFDDLPRIHEGFTDPDVAASVVEAYEASARRLMRAELTPSSARASTPRWRRALVCARSTAWSSRTPMPYWLASRRPPQRSTATPGTGRAVVSCTRSPHRTSWPRRRRCMTFPSCEFQSRSPQMSERPDFDLLVLGGGMAGMSAAADAAFRGASVMVCEVADQLGGTAVLSSGNVWTVPTREAFVQSDPDGDVAMWQVVRDTLDDSLAWLESMGVPVAERHTSSSSSTYDPPPIGRNVDIESFMSRGRRAVEAAGGLVLNGTPFSPHGRGWRCHGWSDPYGCLR